MTLNEYYLYANIYLVLFWTAYRICLKDSSYFRYVRLFLTGTAVFSLMLPSLHTLMTDFITSLGGSQVKASANLPVLYFTSIGANDSFSPATNAGYDLSLANFISVIFVTGSILTLGRYLFEDIRIRKLIKASTRFVIPGTSINAWVSASFSVPFIYRRYIVIPEGMGEREKKIALEHELEHYRLNHQADRMLFNLLRAIYWMNPVFYILRNSLALNHEYQVDRRLLEKHTDPEFYKLSLVKFSVGKQSFNLANRFADSDLKKRLLMMRHPLTSPKINKILSPVFLGILIILFAFACVPRERSSQANPDQEYPSVQDTIHIVMTELTSPFPAETGYGNIMVMMNSRSKIMISGEICDSSKVTERVISEYQDLLHDFAGRVNSEDSNDNLRDVAIRIIVQRDLATDSLDYSQLLTNLGHAIYQVRNNQSRILFDSEYRTLQEQEQKILDNLVPMHLFVAPPKNIGGQEALNRIKDNGFTLLIPKE